jgi:Crinkler effector protein N-terminal domain
MDSNTVALFCLLKGQSLRNSFMVEVYGNQDISDLKRLIKEEMRSTLERVDATLLELYQVSIPIRDNTALQEALDLLENQEPLSVADTINKVFPSPARKHIHVIVNVFSKLLPLIALPFNPHSQPFLCYAVQGNGYVALGEASEQFIHFPLYYGLAAVFP